MSESSGAKANPGDEKSSTQDKLLSNIQRLTTIVLDKLEQGSKDGTLDQAQIRLLGSIGMRALGLWQEILNPTPRRPPTNLDDAVARIARMSSSIERGEQS